MTNRARFEQVRGRTRTRPISPEDRRAALRAIEARRLELSDVLEAALSEAEDLRAQEAGHRDALEAARA